MNDDENSAAFDCSDDDQLIEIFNEQTYGHKIDWEFWLKLPFWESKEAIYLLNILDPEVKKSHEQHLLKNSDIPYFSEVIKEINRINKQLILAERDQEAGKLDQKPSPSAWIKWASDKDIHVPSQLNVDLGLGLDSLLTAEWINPITSALVKDSIDSLSDGDFLNKFKTTKKEAETYLKAWELSELPRWGTEELLSAILLSDIGRDENLIRRSIEIAQESGVIGKYFSPHFGTKWAMSSNYLILSFLANLTNNIPGSYGNPFSNDLEQVEEVRKANSSNIENIPTNSLPSSKVFSAFGQLINLKPNEVTLEFVAGDSGGLILQVSARTVKKRFALSDFDLLDSRTGDMNQQAGLLLGFSKNKRLKNPNNSTCQKMSRLRKLLKKHLGLTDDPFASYNPSIGYEPHFIVIDNRQAADIRARNEAEKKTSSFQDDLENTSIFDDENDEAGEFLRNNK
jgi:hypothetical protein